MYSPFDNIIDEFSVNVTTIFFFFLLFSSSLLCLHLLPILLRIFIYQYIIRKYCNAINLIGYLWSHLVQTMHSRWLYYWTGCKKHSRFHLNPSLRLIRENPRLLRSLLHHPILLPHLDFPHLHSRPPNLKYFSPIHLLNRLQEDHCLIFPLVFCHWRSPALSWCVLPQLQPHDVVLWFLHISYNRKNVRSATSNLDLILVAIMSTEGTLTFASYDINWLFPLLRLTPWSTEVLFCSRDRQYSLDWQTRI